MLFNDKHENKNNIQARKEFIQTYLSLEKQSYRWAQIPESVALEMELPDGHVFSKRGHAFREYHVDTHPNLFDFVKNKEMGGDLSVTIKKEDH